VRLLDDKKLIGQLCALERKPGSARDVIDHPSGPNQHDDLINAAAGACVNAGLMRGFPSRTMPVRDSLC
jgi:hypothetical protein